MHLCAARRSRAHFFVDAFKNWRVYFKILQPVQKNV